MLIRTPSKRIFLICVCGRHRVGWKETKHWSDVEITQQRSRFRRTNIFQGLFILGLHSKTKWNKLRYCGQRLSHVWIENFRGGNWKASVLWEFSYFFMVFMTWLVMQRIVWSDIVSHQTRRLNKSTKYLLPASMTTTSKKKKWNLLEICHKYALILFWNVYTWHELVDLIPYGQWRNLYDRLQNGPKNVTNAWIDWYLTFITHVHTNRLLCWWHCKTMQAGTVSRLRLILRTRNPHFWRNIVRSWKSYSCSNMLDVQETNCCFSKFNRIRNHLSRRWIEIRLHSCSRFVGSDCFLYLETQFRFLKDRGNPLSK